MALSRCAVGLFLSSVACGVAHADWYSGDPYAEVTTWPQFTDNLSTTSQTRAMTFDNFTWVPGSGGGVIDVVGGHFHNFNSGPLTTIDTAYWEIRTGMSSGVAGTLVASGSGATTNYATSFTQGGSTVQGVSVDITNFALPAGNYWFGLAIGSTNPAGAGWFVASTHGANGIGGPLGDNQHLYYQESASVVTWNYVDGVPLFAPGTIGFDPSYFIREVPAPGTGVLLCGVAALIARRRR